MLSDMRYSVAVGPLDRFSSDERRKIHFSYKLLLLNRYKKVTLFYKIQKQILSNIVSKKLSNEGKSEILQSTIT